MANDETGLVAANPYEVINYLQDQQLDLTLDPSRVARIVAGLRPDMLCYIIEQGPGKDPIVGLSVIGANVLAAEYGGIETLPDFRVEDIPEVPVEVIVAWEKDDRGKSRPIKEEIMVPGVRASVRVRSNKNGNVTLGIAEQPRYMVLKDGGRKADVFAVTKAVSKAGRNAKLDHFAGQEALIREFATRARKAGQAFMSGEVPTDQATAAEQAKQTIRANATREQAPLGKVASDRFWAWAADLAAKHPEALPKASFRDDIKAFVQRSWGVSSVAEIPASAEMVLYQHVQHLVPQEAAPPAPPAAPPPAPAAAAEPEPYRVDYVPAPPEEEGVPASAPEPLRLEADDFPVPLPPSELPDESTMRAEYVHLGLAMGWTAQAAGQRFSRTLNSGGPDAALEELEKLRRQVADKEGKLGGDEALPLE